MIATSRPHRHADESKTFWDRAHGAEPTLAEKESAAARRAQRLRMLIAALSIASLITALATASTRAATASPLTTTASSGLVVYATFQQVQYDNHADDRARGLGHNPFGNTIPAYAAATTNEKIYGPLTGDQGAYAFNLYSSTSLTHSAGTSILYCQYNFAKNGFCDDSFQLAGGSILSEGAFPVSAQHFTLAIIGGTGKYRGAKGTIEATASPTGHAGEPEFYANPAGLEVESQRLAFAIVTPPTAPRPPSLSVYARSNEFQYLDHNDDEARGDTDNPLGTLVYAHCAALPHYQLNLCDTAATRAAAAKSNEHNNGPFPGDTSIFAFDLYKSSSFEEKVGSAVLTCQYYFAHYGFCDATFQMANGGTLVGEGTFDFDAKKFSLALTGGSGAAYRDVFGGEVDIRPSGNGQHFAFALT